MSKLTAEERIQELYRILLNEVEASIAGAIQTRLRMLRWTIGSPLWLNALSDDDWQMLREQVLPPLMWYFEQREGCAFCMEHMEKRRRAPR